MADEKQGNADMGRRSAAGDAASGGRREQTAAGPGDQAQVYGSNPPAPDEDQNIRGSGMTDIADVAQNQMPGTPQNLAIDPDDPMDDERRRDFDRTVQEYQRKHRGG